MIVSKNTTNRKFIHSDFDRDGVKNVDDTYPFDKSRSIPKNTKSFRMRSQYVNDEVKLSDELRAIEKNNNSYIPKVNRFISNNAGSYGRIKSVPSTLKKLRERYISSLGDIGGVTVITPDRKGAYAKRRELKKKYSTKKKQDDYYKNPKNKVYYALHNDVLFNKRSSKSFELQIKSQGMSDLGKEIHPYYKKGKIPSFFKKKAKKLFDAGL